MKISKKFSAKKIPSWKRILDVGFIVLISPLVILLAVFLAALIRAVSKGPVLFKQERIGHRGKKFACFKFRTMCVGADTVSHQGHLEKLIQSNAPMRKMDANGDSRIIPFGRLLRASGLDELPQLFNVLRGEMSIVGPRPCLPYEFEKYLPWQKERFNAVPGLTGLWQVSGKNRTTFVEMIRFDIEYARTQNFWLDCKIIFKTAPALLMQLSEVGGKKTEIVQPAVFSARAANH